jgi:Holliday junction resolvasome RuvABC endonuclease subunit
MSRRVLCVDPGFRWLGWAIVAAGREVDTIVAMGVIRTKKSDKKRGVRKVDDNFRSAQEIATQLLDVVLMYSPQALAFEAYSQVRSASVAGQLAMPYGILALLSVLPGRTSLQRRGLPAVSATPGEIRKALGADSKNAAEAAVRKHFSSPLSLVSIARFERAHAQTKSNHSHAWDGLAAYLACRDSEVLRALRFL